MAESLLRRRDVRLIVGSVGVSALGDFLAFVPLMLRMQEMSGSGLAVAALLIALWGPIVVLSPVVGTIVDRVESRSLLVWASVGQAAVALALAFAVDSVTAILVLAALLGIGFSLSQPAEFSLVPVIGAGTGQLNELNGYVESFRYGGMAMGPLIGGALASAGGTDVAMIGNAATFGVVALAATFLSVRRPPQRGTSQDGIEEYRARDGFVYLFRDRLLGLVVTVAFVSLLFFTASASAEVFFVKDVLGKGDTAFGIVYTGWVVGMAAGALVVSRHFSRGTLALGALVMIAVQGVGIGSPTAWLVYPFAVVMYSIGGVGHGAKNTLIRTLIQERVPDRLHGRAFAAYNGLRNGPELFALAAGGVLVSAIGARTTLTLAGVIPVLVALVGLAVYRGRREPPPVVEGPAPVIADAAAAADPPAIPS